MRDYDYESDEPFVVIEKTTTSIGSFLFGLAIGAGVALLMAPRSGAETRRDLRRRARKVREAAENAAEELTESVTDKFGEARQHVEERIDSARQAVELKKKQVTRAVEAGRAAAQQARDDLERRIAETKAAYDAGSPGGGARREGGARRTTRTGSAGE
jgi:gas vesicle protein